MILTRTEHPDGTVSFDANGFHLANLHHHSADCDRHGCVVHNPTMTDPANREGWPYNWREDRGIMERICPDGIGHPDADAARYMARIGHAIENIHGCDGCCA